MVGVERADDEELRGGGVIEHGLVAGSGRRRQLLLQDFLREFFLQQSP